MKTIAPEVDLPLALASTLSERLEDFLAPLLVRLDELLDRRLVRTFAATIEIFLQQRYRASGLLLSESAPSSPVPLMRLRGPSGSAIS